VTVLPPRTCRRCNLLVPEREWRAIKRADLDGAPVMIFEHRRCHAWAAVAVASVESQT